MSWQELVRKLVDENECPALKSGLPLLHMYMSNLIRDPKNPRFKRISTANLRFQQNVKVRLWVEGLGHTFPIPPFRACARTCTHTRTLAYTALYRCWWARSTC